MKKALPIAVILCVLLFAAMLGKTIVCKVFVISPIFILVGFALGFLLLIIHEWLHGIVYPKDADVTIGRIKGKTTFVALASYPLKRDRFILMCLLPFVLGAMEGGKDRKIPIQRGLYRWNIWVKLSLEIQEILYISFL